MVRRAAAWAFAMLYCDGAGASINSNRRCVDDTVTGSIGFSSCDACDFGGDLFKVQNPLNVTVVMMTQPPSLLQAPLLSVASQLVSAGLRVSLVYESDNRDSLESILKEKITASVSCDVEQHIGQLLSMQKVNRTSDRVAPAESPYDALSRAESDYQSLQGVLDTENLPDVIVLHAANVGGVMLAEKLGVASVLVAPPAMLRLITEKVSPSTGIIDCVQRRMESFGLARRFMQMNKLRRLHGLEFLRTPSDYFESSTIVLVNELPELATDYILPPHVHLVAPLLPRCISCEKHTIADNGATIVVLTAELNMFDTRRLVRGLLLARAEFQSFVDNACHPDNPSSDIHADDCNRVRKLAESEIVWQSENHTVLPELLPPFFFLEQEKPSLETVASYPNVVAVVSHCNSESYPINAFGSPLVCVPTSSGNVGSTELAALSRGRVATLQSTSIAESLLTTLIGQNEKTTHSNEDRQESDTPVDGGILASEIIQTIAAASQEYDVDRLRVLVSAKVGRETLPPSDTSFLVATAIGWNIVLYIVVGYAIRYLYKRAGQEGIMRHLRELDLALDCADRMWWSNENSVHNRIDGFLQQLKPQDEQVQAPQEQTKRDAAWHHYRRRRAVKRR